MRPKRSDPLTRSLFALLHPEFGEFSRGLLALFTLTGRLETEVKGTFGIAKVW